MKAPNLSALSLVLWQLCISCAATPAADTPEPGLWETPAQGPSGPGASQSANAAPGQGASVAVAEKAPRPVMSAGAQPHFKNGQAAFVAGDLAGAQSQFETAITKDGRAYQAHYMLGVVYERLGQGDKAKSSYLKALSVVPDHEGAVSSYALLVAREGRADEAANFLQKKSAERGKSAAILATLAEVMSQKGESGRAQELAQEALKLDPSHKPAMVTLARDHYRARRIDLALYALTGILDGYGPGNPPRDKDNGEARFLRGLIYSERGLRGPAMDEMKLAVKARPDLVDAHLVLANYMMGGGNAAEARPHLEMAVRYDRMNISAHLQLGDAYRLLGRPDDARRELDWVLAAAPNQAAAHYNLGLLFLLGGKITGLSEPEAIAKAIEHLEAYKARGQRGGPDDVDDLVTRAKTRLAILKAQSEQAPTAADGAGAAGGGK